MKKIKLCYLVSHPIQYQAPMLRLLAQQPGIELCVYFFESCTNSAYKDKGFCETIKWDTDLLGGYCSKFLGKLKYYQIGKELKKHKYDVLWIHGYANIFLIYTLVISKLLSIKTLVRGESVYKFIDHSKYRNRLKSFLFNKLLNRIIHGFLSIGTLNKNFYLKHGVPLEKIYHVPYTVDNGYFSRQAKKTCSELNHLKKEIGLDNDRLIILYASKFQKRKCADHLLCAYHQMLGKTPTNKWPYLIFIGNGELANKLKQYVKKNELNTYVHFLGFKNQSELPAFYQLCDIFVLPSKKENWGLVINEVMNAGKALIVSDEVGCAPDLVTRDNGFIFPAGNINLLSQALYQLVMDRELCKRLGARSVETINQWGLPETVNGIVSACIDVLN